MLLRDKGGKVCLGKIAIFELRKSFDPFENESIKQASCIRKKVEDVRKMFNSVGDSMYTLFEIMSTYVCFLDS